MNVLDVADRNRILDLLRRGWSIRQVARDTGHRHETIRRYGIEAGILVPKPAKCTTSAEVATDSKPHTEPEVPAGSVPKPHTAPEVPTGSTRSSAEPFRDFIEAELGKGRNAKAIFQDLAPHRGYDGSTMRSSPWRANCEDASRRSAVVSKPSPAKKRKSITAKAHPSAIHAPESIASLGCLR
jgi:hypothetical protein